MNLNDYTYHVCDRFVLMFIACIGLLGTSYILVNGSASSSHSAIENLGIGLQTKIENASFNSYFKNTDSGSDMTSTILLEEANTPAKEKDITALK